MARSTDAAAAVRSPVVLGGVRSCDAAAAVRQYGELRNRLAIFEKKRSGFPLSPHLERGRCTASFKAC